MVLAKVKQIQIWFNSQTDWAFYASSLLTVFEGDETYCENPGPHLSPSQNATSKCSAESSNSKTQLQMGTSCTSNTSVIDKTTDGVLVADIRVIDFAHVFPNSEKDDNYIQALQSLVRYLERLLLM